MKVVVLMGGWSAEREISLQGGEAVYQALKNQNISCLKFDLTHDNLDELWQLDFDKVFIMLHGKGGEDGFIQQQLEQRNIPFTGSDSIASKIAMDKITTKQKWLEANIATPKFILYKNKVPDFPLPWAVKPALEGSSLGITKVEKESQLKDAIKQANKFNQPVMIEQWIEGEEYTVAILNDIALPVIKLKTKNTFYDYEAKYDSDETAYLCPCGLSKKNEQLLQQLSLNAFKCVGAKTWARVDIMLDKNQNPYLLEINTIPGMTSHSLVPMAAHKLGITFAQLVKKILYSE
jgi:D-alanine-D-alanine ligase